MESYFVRTLGMHRVYNSAFMHMLKNQDNAKYRNSMKKTLSFDPEILKRYVNFMNNPDEETAIAQFGYSDKYFGVCTVLSTLPGLPMFGHGQIEGYYEKYGMEFSKAYWDEKPNEYLIQGHYEKIFPLLKKRYLFSGVNYFELFDIRNENGICEDIYFYVNGNDKTKTLVTYNNSYERKSGYATNSCPKLHRLENGERVIKTQSFAQSLGLSLGGARFVIFKNFNTNLYHIEKSIKLFDEGFFVSLDGYQTSVFLDIHEVEDFDGSYSTLYERYGNKGIKDIKEELALIRLEPICIASANFFDKNMQLLLQKIISKDGTKKDCNKYLIKCGEAYKNILELKHESNISILKYFNLVSLDRLKIFLNRLNDIQKTTTYLANIKKFTKEIIALIHIAYFLKPFIKVNDSIITIQNKIDSLYLHKLFYNLLKEIEPNEDLHKSIVNKIPFLLFDFHLTSCKTSNGKLRKLLKNEDIKKYIDVNTYKSVEYYNQEKLQDVLTLVIINQLRRSQSESNKDLEKIYLSWLEKESQASWIFTNLL